MNPNELDWHYVNLKSRPDRDQHARDQFARHGITPTRFDAFTPDQWNREPEKVERMRNRTPGAIGCYQSQVALIREAHLTGKTVVVCEDDVVFCSDLPKRLDYITANMPRDWDIFYLGATFHVPGVWCHHADCATWGEIGVDVEPTADPHILRTYGIWGTYCYIVNPANAGKVYDLMEANIHGADGIDHLAIRLGPKLRTFCFVPGCVWQYDNESNIGSGITRFSGFKKLGPYAWTERMENFDPTTFDWKAQ